MKLQNCNIKQNCKIKQECKSHLVILHQKKPWSNIHGSPPDQDLQWSPLTQWTFESLQ